MVGLGLHIGFGLQLGVDEREGEGIGLVPRVWVRVGGGFKVR